MLTSDDFEDGEAVRTTMERQPLLTSIAINAGAAAIRPDSDVYVAVGNIGDGDRSDRDNESEDEEDERQFKEHLEGSGGWWAYIKEYSIFLPHLWPRRNRKLQLYLLLMGVCIAVQRVLNVLIPRQEGIVVEKLVQTYATGELPWRELIWWFSLRFINSPGTLGTLHDFLQLCIDNWSTRQMTNLIFSHIMGLSMDFHANADSGELMKATEQASSLTKLLRLLLFELAPIIVDVIVAVFYVTSLFDIYFAGIMIVMATIYGLLTWKGSALEARKRRTYASRDRNTTKVQYQSISNWTTVSYFNRRDYQHFQLMSSLGKMIASLRALRITELSVDTARIHVLFLGQMCANFLAAYRVVRGERPVGNFIALNSIWNLFTEPLYIFSYLSEDITSYIVDAERALQILQRKPTVTESPDARELNVELGRVRFENVSLSYNERTEIIKGISFVAQPGQTIALVGETGAGKSTLLKLLFRFYDVTGGSITIDGVDIREVTLGSLREAFGIVPQETSLFNTSVLENVRYARLDASDEEVVEACMQACIHDKIMAFPNQYDTVVGERGVKLSGGERQRISIARVILKRPKLLFLDEASSAIDSKTELEILTALRKFSEGLTTFIIAHRLSTVVDADVILVLDNGRIIESGTHQSLVRMGGRYKQLWDIQTSHSQALG
ncbi:P-loop containing nucleoside triphosphate hydrolase protein [Xylariaceae sp. FL0662B]|nr:P-loop containing nucleoside triphosphate hydrolase protein [Xylariaceae sp. FL0662B]